MDRNKDVFFKQNIAGAAAVEFLWGLGFPIVLESTFLQLFLKTLGASSFAIGVVPSLFTFGIAISPLFASYISKHYQTKKSLVTILHICSGSAILMFGLLILLLQPSRGVLPLFFISYTLFSLAMGLTIPVWLDYITRIFSETRMVPGLGYMMMGQNLGKIISSFFILKIVEMYAFSLVSAAWVFIATGLFFIIGSLFFLCTKELSLSVVMRDEKESFIEHTLKSTRRILGNRNFLCYLAADIDIYIILTTMSFYANYATGFFQVPSAIAAGVYVACVYAGSITVNIFLGAMNLLQLKQKLYLSKAVTLLLLALLVCFPAYSTFFVISYFLGVGRAIRNMLYPPSVKKFAGRDDATAYYAMAPILTLPIGSGLPLLFGEVLDRLAFLGADAYRLEFIGCGLLVLSSLYFVRKMEYPSG